MDSPAGRVRNQTHRQGNQCLKLAEADPAASDVATICALGQEGDFWWEGWGSPQAQLCPQRRVPLTLSIPKAPFSGSRGGQMACPEFMSR